MSLIWLLLFSLQTNGEPLSQTTFVQARSGLRITPERQAILLDPAGPPVVITLNYDGSLQADMTIEAALIGPGLDTPYTVSVPAESGRISLPRDPFTQEGVYRLINTRLVRTGQAITFAEPESVEIQVAENFLLSEVQVAPLSRQDLVDRGYLFSDEDYYTVEFQLALMIGSKEENVTVPVAFPKKETEAFEPVVLADPFKPYLRMLTFPVSPEPGALPPGFSPDPPSAQQYIPGLILIPGNFNYLRSHFEVTCLVLNAAPEGFDVQVSRLKASIDLPDPTVYGLPLTLRDEATKDMTFPGEDGQVGTADDRDVIRPGEKAETGYIVVGNIPGMYDVSVTVTGEVQLPQETQNVTTVTRGQIFVRSPEFNITFEHPDAVAENEVYELVMNIVNRGEIPLEGFSVTLDPGSLVGCQLVDTHPVQQAPDIPVGGTGRIRYQLRAELSGTVISSYFKVDGANQSELQLRVGVGEIGQRISPYVVHFPEIFHSEFPGYLTDALRQYAKTGLDIAQMVETELPTGLVPVTPSSVRELNSLSVFAARAGTMGFSDQEQLARLFSLWVRSVGDYDPLDRVRRRQTNLGSSNTEDAFARAFAETFGQDDAALLRLLAEENETTPNVFALLVTADQPVDILLENRNQTTTGSRTTPFSARLALSPTRTLFWIHHTDTVPRFNLQSRSEESNTAAVTALFPGSDNSRRLAHQAEVAFDSRLDVRLDMAQHQVRLTPQGGLAVTVAAPTLAPKPFELKNVRQIDPDILPGADVFGRDVLFSFSKPLDLNSLDPIEEHILINGKPAVDAKLQPDGTSLIVSARMPLGPYHPIHYNLRAPRAKSGEGLSDQAGALQGSPWFIGCSVSGRVVDRFGSNLSRAKIFHWKSDPYDINRWRIFETTGLDEAGRYAFDFSPFPVFSDSPKEKLRTLKIGVLLEDGRYEEREFYPAGAGQQLVADFSFLQVGGVRGTVRDGESNPIAGATVFAVNQSNELSAVLTETDEFGNYRADGLEVGQILVKSAHEGIIGYASGYLTQNNAPLTIDVAVANPSVTIDGTVNVLEADGPRPIEGAIVAFVQQNSLTASVTIGNKQYPYTTLTTTDATGRYRLEETPVGNGFWWIYAPQYGYVERLIAVTAGENQTINHQFDDTPVPRGTVAGLVRTTGGTPVAGAVVFVDGQRGETNDLGRFEIPFVERGLNHRITASHPNFGNGTFSLFFDSERDDSAVIVLRQPITVSGRFVNAVGEPMPFANIYNPPYPVVIEPLAQTDADGRWTATLPQPGTYAVTTVDWPHIAAVADLQVTESGASEVLLQQWEKADLRVRLVDSAGRPVVAKVGVRSMLPDDFTLSLGLPKLKLSHVDQFTNPQGEITIPNLNIGNFEVWGESIFLGETETFRGTLEPQADGSEPRTITLVFPDSLEPANLFGRVFGTDGVSPAPEGTLVQVKGPGLNAVIRTDAQGNYRFENLVQTDTPVRISIIAGHPDTGVYDTAWVDLNQDINFRYDLALRRKGTAEIRVINGDGTPADSAAVEVTYRDVEYVPPTEPDALGEMYEEPIRRTLQLVPGSDFLHFEDIPTGPFTIRVNSGNGLVGLRSYVIPINGGLVSLTIKLEAGSHISGTFLDQNEQTIAAAEIQLLEFNRLLQQRLSDEDGSFAFPNIPMRTYRLNGTNPADGLQANATVVTSPYQPDVAVVLRIDDVAHLEGILLHEGQPIPNARVTIENRNIRVVTGSDSNGRYRFHNLPLGDYEISAESSSLLSAVKTGVTLSQPFTVHQRDLTFGRLLDVSLSVTGADGLPVPGLLVTVENLDYAQVVGNSALTDDDGIALLRDLPTGTYRISGDHPEEVAPLNGRFTITEADGEPAMRSIQFTGWGAVSGLVRDTAGQPLSEPVHVTFEYRVNRIRSTQTISTDTAGRFRADRLPVDSAIKITAVNVLTQKAATQEVTLTQHREEAEIDLVFRAATYVSGQVLFADGSPAVAADVWVKEPYTVLVQTDDLGEFLLQPVLEGETTLFAKARDSERKAAVTLNVVVTDGAPVPIEQLDVPLGGVATITGTVRYSDGTPLRTGNVTLDIPELDLSLNTLILGDGTYTFTQVPLGTYHMSALDRRFDTKSEPVVFSADSDGAQVTQDLVFAPSYELTGRLMGTNGAAPVNGGLVELWRPDPIRPETFSLIYAATTDADGYFVIEHVYPGPYQLVAEDPTLSGNYSAPFTMPNQDLDLPPISLRTRAWILGSLADSDGDPFTVGTVRLTQNGRERSQRLNPDGSFEFDNLEVGAYSLYYSLNGGWITGQSAGILVPGANSLPITTVPTHSLSGTAILIRLPPAAPSVQVTVNDTVRAATLNAAGDFVLDGVPAGEPVQVDLSYGRLNRRLTLDPLTSDQVLGTLYLDTTPPTVSFADNDATVTGTPYRMAFDVNEPDAQSAVDPAESRVWVNDVDLSHVFTTTDNSLFADFATFPEAFRLGTNELRVHIANEHGATREADYQLNVALDGVTLVVELRRNGQPVSGQVRLDNGEWITNEPDGTLTLTQVSPGRRTLKARDGERGDRLEPILTDNIRQEVVLNLTETGNYQGRVLTSDGRPANNALVTIGPFRETTDADGRFLFDYLPLGESFIVATGEHTQTVLQPPPLTQNGETVDVGDLNLEEQGAVAGVVVDDDGVTPVTGVLVRLQVAGLPAEWAQTTLSDSTGRFEFSPVLARDVTVQATTTDGSRSGIAFANVPGRDQTARVTVVLSPAADLVGRLLDRDGGVRAATPILAVRDGLTLETVTDEEGRFQLSGLPYGDYQLQAEVRDLLQYLDLPQTVNEDRVDLGDINLVLDVAPTINAFAFPDPYDLTTRPAIALEAADDRSLAGYELVIDGADSRTVRGSLRGTTVAQSINPNIPGTAAEGPITWRLTIRDHWRQTTVLSGVSNLTFAGGGPSLTVHEPLSGATFVEGETILVRADAADPAGITRVDISLDGNPVGSDTTRPYQLEFAAPGVIDPSVQTLAVTATSARGQQTTLTRDLLITPRSSEGGPTVSLRAPENSIPLPFNLPDGLNIAVHATAVDPDGLESVAVAFNGSPVFSAALSGNESVLDTTIPLPVAMTDTSDLLVEITFTDLGGNPTRVFSRVANAPLPSDAEIFTEANPLALENWDVRLRDKTVVLAGGDHLIDGPHQFANLILVNGAQLSQTATNSTGSLPAWTDLTLTGRLIVDFGSAFDLNGKGYRAMPPGVGDGRIFATHGGLGHQSDAVNFVYGSAFEPTRPGARYGGGAVKINADSLWLSGNIHANSRLTGSYLGSGGSIWLIGNTYAGRGHVTANGFHDDYAGSTSLGGGGGRIAIYGPFSGRAEAFGGKHAGAGTLYLGDGDRFIVANHPEAVDSNLTWLPTLSGITVGTDVFATDELSPQGIPRQVLSFINPPVLTPDVFIGQRAFNPDNPTSGARVANQTDTRLFSTGETRFGDFADGDRLAVVYAVDHIEVRDNAHLRLDHDPGAVFTVSDAHLDFGDQTLNLAESRLLLGEAAQVTGHLTLAEALTVTDQVGPRFNGSLRLPSITVAAGRTTLNGRLEADQITVAADAVLGTPYDINDARMQLVSPTITIDGLIEATETRNSANNSADGNPYYASHGGYGGAGGRVDYDLHTTLGSMYVPETVGGVYNANYGAGGAVRLDFDTLTLTGNIHANGAFNSRAPGGSILLQGQTLLGDGNLQANGGGGYYTGGGGRIAVRVADINGFQGETSAAGGVYATTNLDFIAGAGTIFYQTDQWPNGRLVLDNKDNVSRHGSTLLPSLGRRTLTTDAAEDEIALDNLPAFNDLAGLYLLLENGDTAPLAGNSSTVLRPAPGRPFPTLPAGSVVHGLHVLDVLELRGNANLKTDDHLRVLQQLVVAGGSIDAASFSPPQSFSYRDGRLELFQDPGLRELTLDNFQLTVHFPLDLTNLTLSNGATLHSAHPITASTTRILDGTLSLDGSLRGEVLEVASQGVLQTPPGVADAGLRVEVAHIDIAGQVRAHGNPNSINPEGRYNASHGGYGGSVSQVNYDIQQTYGTLYYPQTNGTATGSNGNPGGHLHLVFTELNLSGEMNVDGTAIRSAAGSILLEGQTLNGSGSLSANGYDGTYSSGGGRIAVLVENLQGFDGPTTAFGGRASSSDRARHAGAGTVFYRNSQWPNGRLVIDNNGTDAPAGATTLPGLGQRSADGATGGDRISGFGFPAFNSLHGLHLMFADGTEVPIDNHSRTDLFPPEGRNFPSLAAGDTYRAVHVLDVLEIRGRGQLRSIDGIRILEEFIVRDGGVDSPDLEIPTDTVLRDGAVELFEDPGYTNVALDNFQLTVNFPLNIESLSLENGAQLITNHTVNAQTTELRDGTIILNGTLRGESLNVAAAGELRTPGGVVDAGLMLDVTNIHIAGTVRAQNNPLGDNPDNRYGASHGGYGASAGQVDYDEQQTYGSLYQPDNSGARFVSSGNPGGRIHARFTTMTLSGEFNAAGTRQRSAGGSILLEGQTLNGDGRLNADGANDRYSAGGGRIAVLVDDQQHFNGIATAFGGTYPTSNLSFQSGAGTLFFRDADRWPNGRLVIDNNGIASPAGSTTLPGLGERTVTEPSDGGSITGRFPERNGLVGLHLHFPDDSVQPIAAHDGTRLFPEDGNRFPALTTGETYRGIHILDELIVRGAGNLRTPDGLRVLSHLEVADGAIDSPNLELPDRFQFTNGTLSLYQDPGLSELTLDNFHLTVHFPLNLNNLTLRNGATLTSSVSMNVGETVIESGVLRLNGTLTGDSLTLSDAGRIETPADILDAGLILNVTNMVVAGTIAAHQSGNSANTTNLYFAGHGGYGASAGQVNYDVQRTYGSLYRPQTVGSGSNQGTTAGGLVHLIFDQLDLSGTVDVSSNEQRGAGGTILLEGNRLIGAGLLTANGADNRYSGGGGRVAVLVADQMGFSGTATAFGGSYTTTNITFQSGAGTVFYRDRDRWPNGRLVVDNNGIPSPPGSTTLPALGQRTTTTDSDGTQLIIDDLPPFSDLTGLHVLFADDTTVPVGSHDTTTLLPASGQVFPTVSANAPIRGVHILDVLEIRGNANLKTDDGIRVLGEFVLREGAIDTPSLEIPNNGTLNDGSIELFEDPGYTFYELDNFQLTVHYPLNVEHLHLRNGSSVTTTQGTITAADLQVDAGSTIAAAENTPGLELTLVADTMDIAGTIRAQGNPLVDNPGNIHNGAHGGLGGTYRDQNEAVSYGSPYVPRLGGTGAASGGAIELRFNRLNLGGRIDADALQTNGLSSGGAILLQGDVLTGSGLLTAKGGADFRYAAGGGRIAVHVADIDAFSGGVEAYGGRAGINSAPYQAGSGTVFYRTDTWPNGRLVLDNGGVASLPGSSPLLGVGIQTQYEPTGGPHLTGENLPRLGGLVGAYVVFPDGQTRLITENTATAITVDGADGLPELDPGDDISGRHLLDILEVRGGANLRSVDPITVVQNLVLDNGTIDAPALTLPEGFQFNGSRGELVVDPGLPDLVLNQATLKCSVPLAANNLTLANGSSLEINHPITLTQHLEIGIESRIFSRATTADLNPDNRYRSSHGGQAGGYNRDAEFFGSPYLPQTSGRANNSSLGAGGTIDLTFATFALNGSLSADGQNRGAGGSILLRGNSLYGGGAISANGGAEYRNSAGGGRIALWVEDLYEFGGTVTAYGGRAGLNGPQYHAGAGTVFYRNQDEWPNGRLVIDNNGTETEAGTTTLVGMGTLVLTQDSTPEAVFAEGLPPFNALAQMWLRFPDGSEHRIGGNSESALFPETGQSFPTLQAGDTLTAFHRLDVLEILGQGQLATIDGLEVIQSFTFAGGGLHAAPLQLPMESGFTQGSLDLYSDPGLNNLMLESFHLNVHIPLSLESLTLDEGASLATGHPLNAERITIYEEATLRGLRTEIVDADETGFRTSHGGWGGGWSSDQVGTYGSFYHPRNGGRGDSPSDPAGGQLHLTFDELRLDGTLDVSGTRRSSGGSILLEGNRLLGTGTMQADGAADYRNSGGGGRIAIHVNDLTGYEGTYSARGGRAGINAPQYHAGAGTIFLRTPGEWPNGRLIIDNGDTESPAGSTTLPGLGRTVLTEANSATELRGPGFPALNGLTGMHLVFENGDLVPIGAHTAETLTPATGSFPIQAAGTAVSGLHRLDVLEISGQAQVVTVDALEVLQGIRWNGGALQAGTLQLAPGTVFRDGALDLYSDPGLDAWELDGFTLQTHFPTDLDALTLRNGAVLDLNQPLSAATMDVGIGTRITARERGGDEDADSRYRSSHGGYGGPVDYAESLTLGNLYQPRTGGRADNSLPEGGGVVNLSFQTLTLEGDIDVSGINTGAGGSIWLRGNQLSGSGNILANGGAAYRNAGGGGRIALWVEDLDTHSGLITAFGGRAGINSADYHGGAGTVFFRNQNQWPNGRLVIDNNDTPTNGASTTLPYLGSFFLEGMDGDRVLGEFPEFQATVGMYLINADGDETEIIAQEDGAVQVADADALVPGTTYYGLHIFDEVEVRGAAQFYTDDGVRVNNSLTVTEGSSYEVAFEDAPILAKKPSSHGRNGHHTPPRPREGGRRHLGPNEVLHLSEPTHFQALYLAENAQLTSEVPLQVDVLECNGGRISIEPSPIDHGAALKASTVRLNSGHLTLTHLVCDELIVGHHARITPPVNAAILRVDTAKFSLDGTLGRRGGETWLLHPDGAGTLSGRGRLLGTTAMRGGTLVNAALQATRWQVAGTLELVDTTLILSHLETDHLLLRRAHLHPSPARETLRIRARHTLALDADSTMALDGSVRKPGYPAHGGLPRGFGLDPDPSGRYDSPLRPSQSGRGEAAGGVLVIETPELLLDGRLSARGKGFSSGGAIQLHLDRLTGSGRVDVSGGVTASRFASRQKVAGGGRIAVHLRDWAFTGDLVTGSDPATVGSLAVNLTGRPLNLLTGYRSGEAANPIFFDGYQVATAPETNPAGNPSLLWLDTQLQPADITGLWLYDRGTALRIKRAVRHNGRLGLELVGTMKPGAARIRLDLPPLEVAP